MVPKLATSEAAIVPELTGTVFQSVLKKGKEEEKNAYMHTRKRYYIWKMVTNSATPRPVDKKKVLRVKYGSILHSRWMSTVLLMLLSQYANDALHLKPKEATPQIWRSSYRSGTPIFFKESNVKKKDAFK